MVNPVKRSLVHLFSARAKVSAVGAQPTTSTTFRPRSTWRDADFPGNGWTMMDI